MRWRKPPTTLCRRDIAASFAGLIIEIGKSELENRRPKLETAKAKMEILPGSAIFEFRFSSSAPAQSPIANRQSLMTDLTPGA
jgi:hypothetical protein